MSTPSSSESGKVHNFLVRVHGVVDNVAPPVLHKLYHNVAPTWLQLPAIPTNCDCKKRCSDRTKCHQIGEQTIKNLPPGTEATKKASNVRGIDVKDAGNVKDVNGNGTGNIDGKDAISAGLGRMADSNAPEYTNPIPEQTIKDLPPGAKATQMASNVKDVHVQDAGNVKDVKGDRNEVKAGNFNFGRIKDVLENLPPEAKQKTSNVSDIDVKDAGNVKDIKGNENKVRAGNFNFGGVS